MKNYKDLEIRDITSHLAPTKGAKKQKPAFGINNLAPRSIISRNPAPLPLPVTAAASR